MSKSAILADTGTRAERFRGDFVPAYVLKALAYLRLGERHNAERAIEDAVHAWTTRRLIDALTECLQPVQEDASDPSLHAAKALLLSGLPAGVNQHPRDPVAAVRGALSYATDLRQVSLESKRRDRPAELQQLKRRELRGAFEHLDSLTKGWKENAAALPADLLADVDADAAGLMALLDQPSLVVFVERGRGPRKVNSGRYGELLQLVPRPKAPSPRVSLDAVPLQPQLLDSLSWQATTRGGRAVDGFLSGKAVFKDASVGLGYSMIIAGDIASAADSPELAVAAYVAGIFTWIAGATTNPRADVRAWEDLPDDLYLLVGDPSPGTHQLRIDGQDYTVDIPDVGTVVHLIPNTAPWGVRHFGTPCVRCDAPIALPAGGRP
jgi:hypothetical protein